MANEENDCHSQFFLPNVFPPFRNNDDENEMRHSCFSAVEKLFFMTCYHLKTLFQTLNQMSQISRRTVGVNPSSSYDLV